VQRVFQRVVVLVLASTVQGCTTAPADPTADDRPIDSIAEPLTTMPGDPVRGREVVGGRDANCLFCHAIPETSERFMGNIGPPLAGVATRLTAGQIRLRIVDPTRLNRDVVMPAYHRVEGLERVAPAYRGKPILTAQQIEDVIAYLLTLK
jgi:sulfur-oxidizing protein SoxX